MKNIYVLLCLTYCFPSCLSAQSYSEDSLRFVQTLEWLQQKLTYSYYNGDDAEWWANSMSFDPKTGKVTVRNVSSERLGSIQSRTHIQRSFYFSDMNPYTVKVEVNDQNSGRLVSGKLVKIETYQFEKAVNVTTNGNISSDQTFVIFSIPKVMEDSVSDFSTALHKKLEAAILLATRLYPTGSYDGDVVQLFETLNDRFVFKSSEGYAEIDPIFEDVLELGLYNDQDKLVKKIHLKKLPQTQAISWLEIESGKPITMEEAVFDPKAFSLKSDEGPKIEFINKHEFILQIDGLPVSCIRENSIKRVRTSYR